jgi:hypothetical protein
VEIYTRMIGDPVGSTAPFGAKSWFFAADLVPAGELIH